MNDWHTEGMNDSFNELITEWLIGRMIEMNEWLIDWLNEWLNYWMNDWTSEWMIDWLNERMKDWMNE